MPDPAPPAEPGAVAQATIDFAIDRDNFGDGRDLAAGFSPPANESDIAEYRVLVSTGPLSVPEALEAPAGSFRAVAPASGSSEILFDASATDVEGLTLSDGVAYVLHVLSVSADPERPSALAGPSEPVTLEDTPLVRTLVPSIAAGTGGMEVDSDGNIYMADFGASLDGPPGTRVYRITPAGEVSVFAEGLSGASGNAFDSDGNLFQSNIAASTISRIAPDGTVTAFAGDGLVNPVGIAVAPGDTLYVANCGNNTIRKVLPDGTTFPFAASGLLNCPNGITLADDGNFYVANFGNGGVLRVSQDGEVTALASVPGGNNGHILFGNGALYLVARNGHRIYRLGLDGTATVLAGTGERGQLDGAALSARLSLTNDVALSPDGTVLYFNDVAATSGSPRVINPSSIRSLELDTGG